MVSIKSTKQVRQFWDCFTKQLALPKQIDRIAELEAEVGGQFSAAGMPLHL